MMIHNLVPWKRIYFLNVSIKSSSSLFGDVGESSVPHLQVGAVVLGDVRTVALTENRDLLLDVLDLILSLLQVDGLYGNNALCAIIDAFEHLREEETGGGTSSHFKKRSIQTAYGVKMAARPRTSPKEPFPMRSSLVNSSSGSI